MREAFHWVPIGEKDDDGEWIGGVTLYLVVDGAGGHGTDTAIESYKKMLMDEFNIKLVFQIPQSPETNVLDLGIWMSLQAAVEKCHRLQRGDKEALNATVMKVREEVANEAAFNNVFDRLKKVYALILKDNGGNNLVEESRGKKGTEELAAERAEAEAEAQAQAPPPLPQLQALEEDEDDEDMTEVGIGYVI